jgi:negative regulator of sigma E activity
MSVKISALLDGQLDSREVQQVLGEADSNPGLRDRYTVYGLIGDVLRGNSTPDDGYTIRILKRLREHGCGSRTATTRSAIDSSRAFRDP